MFIAHNTYKYVKWPPSLNTAESISAEIEQEYKADSVILKTTSLTFILLLVLRRYWTLKGDISDAHKRNKCTRLLKKEEDYEEL